MHRTRNRKWPNSHINPKLFPAFYVKFHIAFVIWLYVEKRK